ncbi:MAG TPA: ATP-dependent DNA helicase RecG [Phycicoccus sp.]|jgi:ATP-dependent DNA helicase RecG|nr:ATP-dependent DNA helicase RecG [Phycicoccus sp.]HQY97547.1 ATP-dependent DNA helicase RecG [Phycicoccus sp.]HRA45635.1 ATP-dependent DNA helicase RecG [Phycicoccus sp.]
MTTEATLLTKLLPKVDANKFAKARGLETVSDLLAFWPRRYRPRESDLGGLKIGDYVVAVAEVKTATTRPMKNRRGRMLQAVITDGTHDLDITFFNAHGHEHKLRPGARGLFAGTVGQFNRSLQLTHPGYTLLDDFDAGERKDLIPIYLAVGNLPTWKVTETVRTVLDLLDDADDALPEEILDRRDLPSRLDALRGIHTPDSWAEIEVARRRLRYEEALLLQLALARRRALAAGQRTVARRSISAGIQAAFDARLPFELTNGQREIGTEIEADLAAETPMHRLLQGEVGSGKTLVALRAMLTVIDAGGQAALLAPTEVLATQHTRSITGMLGDLAEGGLLGGSVIGTRVALLTGSQSAAERKKALLEIASGQAGIVVGTHALLQEHVQFADLALVVVDEQHRFGVEQRDALRGKGESPPHVLVMTATPIPRTVAMTVFGDLETSTLRELPAGRGAITTTVIPESRPDWIDRAWHKVADEIRLGRQAYVVCPRIGDDDPPEDELYAVGSPSAGGPTESDGWPDGGMDGAQTDGAQDAAEGPARPLHSVLATLALLAETPALAGLRLGMLHGRLPAEEKESTMLAFTRGEIDVLVSTTVIEVGVDVHNASVMVVLDADRFGVSQLHQLRGRVGRGGLPGLCVLMTGATPESPAGERLRAVAATTDGFELARLDLTQRREGDILGAAQHGRRTQLEFLHVLEHEDLIEQAREDAFALIDADPELAQHPALAAALAARLDVEQAAFLERG